MKEGLKKYLINVVETILRPLIKIMIHYELTYPVFAEIIKKIYVDVAHDHYPPDDKPQTNTNVSIITGISRKEVLRFRRQTSHEIDDKQLNRALRVVNGWLKDKAFLNKNGSPKTLEFKEEKNSFTDLAKKYSGDITAFAILEKLEKMGKIQKLKNGKLKLVSNNYLSIEKDEKEMLNILGTDTANLIKTIEHNIFEEDKLFQRKVYYNNIPEETIEKFKKLSNKKSMELLETLDLWLSKQKRANNPETRGIGVGIYYFKQENEKEEK